MKNKLSLFILGLVSGMLFIGVCIGAGFAGYFSGNYLINKASSLSEKKEAKAPEISISDSLNLDFESLSDVVIFNTQESALAISDKFTTLGKHSLFVEFPGGRKAPGIFFDIIDSKCLNWQNMSSFSFNVFNSITASATLNVRIKSGKKYPKHVYMKSFSLPPLSWTKIDIAKNKLESKLDLDKVSYIGFIMVDPSTTFKLYFDEMKVTMNDEK